MSFEEWVQAISTIDSAEAARDLNDRFQNLRSRTVALYLRRLLSEAPIRLSGISSNHLDQMIWFVLGPGSCYWFKVRRRFVPPEEQVEAVLALCAFYRDFLDPFFASEGDQTQAARGVYMMWDMDCLEGAAMFPGEEHLVEPIFAALATALRCRTKPCQQSALHGLGHLARHHPERVQAEIDWALNEPGHLHSSLARYALEARSGEVL